MTYVLCFKFQSTRSARSATDSTKLLRDYTVISIHALREERDLVVPHKPTLEHGFQSTRSARSATERTS